MIPTDLLQFHLIYSSDRLLLCPLTHFSPHFSYITHYFPTATQLHPEDGGSMVLLNVEYSLVTPYQIIRSEPPESHSRNRQRCELLSSHVKCYIFT
jgi:hypothetical protein